MASSAAVSDLRGATSDPTVNHSLAIVLTRETLIAPWPLTQERPLGGMRSEVACQAETKRDTVKEQEVRDRRRSTYLSS